MPIQVAKREALEEDKQTKSQPVLSADKVYANLSFLFFIVEI
jgi:hypothetical protein